MSSKTTRQRMIRASETAAEMLAEHDPFTVTDWSTVPDRRRHNWGPWHLNRSGMFLWMNDETGYRQYEVDLKCCRTSAEVLDWIIQIAGKQWSNDAILSGLVRALNDVLYPQKNLCSGFMSGQSLTVAQIRRLVKEAPSG
jgi:hypothetical protein